MTHKRRWAVLAAASTVWVAQFSGADASASVRGPQQFDLVCSLHGRVVADPEPVSHGTYPADVKAWRLDERVIVDLQSMMYCDPATCARSGPRPITRVSKGRVYFYDKPDLAWSVDLHDGRSYQRQVDLGRVSITKGLCRKASFSGFAWRFENGRLVRGGGSTPPRP